MKEGKDPLFCSFEKEIRAPREGRGTSLARKEEGASKEEKKGQQKRAKFSYFR